MAVIIKSFLILILITSIPLVTGCSKPRQELKELKLDLLTAIDQQESNLVEEILDSGIDPNKAPIPAGMPLEGAYPLHLAVVKGYGEITKILLNNGADVNIKAKNKDEATPLHWAIFFVQKDMVELLIKSGASINSLDANRSTPVDTASFTKLLNVTNPENSEILSEIITILKNNGGLPEKNLNK